jgi:uncharacterized membrane protein
MDGNRIASRTYEEQSELSQWIPLIAGGTLIAFGIGSRSKFGAALAVVGGGIVLNGVRRSGPMDGLAAIGQKHEGFLVRKTTSIGRPPEYLYRFWRKFQNLPNVMKHLESVEEIDHVRSHWVAKAPAGRTVEWDAIIEVDEPNRRIVWRSVENADVDNAGSVEFLPGPRGTEVKVELQYRPPAGVLGKAIATMFMEEPSMQIAEDLHRFKQLMEAGEVSTTEGQPSGPR